jgi:hypothetical protein
MLLFSFEIRSYDTPRYRAIQIMLIPLNQFDAPPGWPTTEASKSPARPLRPVTVGGVFCAPLSGSPLAGRMPGRDPITTLAVACERTQRVPSRERA